MLNWLFIKDSKITFNKNLMRGNLKIVTIGLENYFCDYGLLIPFNTWGLLANEVIEFNEPVFDTEDSIPFCAIITPELDYIEIIVVDKKVKYLKYKLNSDMLYARSSLAYTERAVDVFMREGDDIDLIVEWISTYTNQTDMPVLTFTFDEIKSLLCNRPIKPFPKELFVATYITDYSVKNDIKADLRTAVGKKLINNIVAERIAGLTNA
jgi:hypothetical protein